MLPRVPVPPLRKLAAPLLQPLNLIDLFEFLLLHYLKLVRFLFPGLLLTMALLDHLQILDVSVPDLVLLEGETSHALPSLVDLHQLGVELVGEEGDEFFEDEPLLPFVILRVVLVRMVLVLGSWGFDGQRKQLV